MIAKNAGGIFLVIGTTVGAGMLSLPLVVAACGFITAVFLMIVSWSVMYLTSLKLIDLCSKHEIGVNFTTLIQRRTSKGFQVVFTLMYLCLLYALMSAYTTQGGDLIALFNQHQNEYQPLNIFVFLLIFGIIVLSVRLTDYVNRTFVLLKIVFFVICIAIMILYFNISFLFSTPLSIMAVLYAWPTLLPSFGFQNIVPVLYEYHQGDKRKIKISVLQGSLAVLVIYSMWLFICFSVLPKTGNNSYQEIYLSGNSLTKFIDALKNQTNSFNIAMFLNLFINISIITSFLCVGLSLYHFIKDTFSSLNIKMPLLLGYILTFSPPFIFSIFYPRGFILALQYAAIFAVYIFIFTPVYLEQKSWFSKINIYVLSLGLLVIITQFLNLFYIIYPF